MPYPFYCHFNFDISRNLPPWRYFENRLFYNPFLVYCRELVLGTVSLTGDRAQGDDSKHDSHYTPDFSYE